MTFDEYAQAFSAHAPLGRLDVFGEVEEAGRSFPLLRFRSPGRQLCVITAGFHGDEIAGPLTLLRHLPEIVARAFALDVALAIYPLVNPSGFALRTRYNASGARPNNDFLRYEREDGSTVGELGPNERFSGIRLAEGGPQETVLLRRELTALPTPAAALDLHQDPYLSGAYTYAYVFPPVQTFAELARASAAHLPLAVGHAVDERHRVGDDGLVVSHDGSVSDYFFRLGTRYVATLETTTGAPAAACDEVNLVWLRGFLERAAAT